MTVINPKNITISAVPQPDGTTLYEYLYGYVGLPGNCQAQYSDDDGQTWGLAGGPAGPGNFTITLKPSLGFVARVIQG